MVRPFLSASLTILFCGALCGQTPTPSPSPSSEIQALTPADLEQAIPLIRDHYYNPAALSETELRRATVAGILQRLGRRVQLLPAKSTPAATPAPFYREVVDGHIGYLRPGDLSRPQLQELESSLRGFAGKNVDAVILDLRGSVEAPDFSSAAEFADRFVAKGKPLFSLRGPGGKTVREFVSNQEPLYSGLIVVLIDGQTVGATEVLAAILRLANALDAEHLQKVRDLHLLRHDPAWILEVDGAGDLTMEQLAATARADMFTETFGRTLIIRPMGVKT